MTLLANCDLDKDDEFYAIAFWGTRRSPDSSESQQVTQLDEEKPAGGIIGGSLRQDRRRRP